MLLILIGLVAAAGAAPRFPFSDETSLESMSSDNMLNMNSFWQNFNRQMATLHQKIAEATQNLPTSITKQGIEGNEYKVEIGLSGFQEKDISVNAGNGMLKVAAIKHIGSESTSSYTIIRSLPDYVGENGSWTYENGILLIVFPINRPNEDVDAGKTNENHSREEVEPNNTDTIVDADIGLDSSNSNSDSELLTNEIPTKNTIVGTNNSEGLKNDYEFLPRYY